MSLFFFFCNIIKVNHFSYLFIVLLHLISSFSLTRSVLVPYAYDSIESIDCILLSSFELKAILFISSVKTFFPSLLILAVFLVYLVFYELCMIFFKYYLCQFYFSLNNLFYLQVELLLNSFYNF